MSHIWPRIHKNIYDFTWKATITPPSNVMGKLLGGNIKHTSIEWYQYLDLLIKYYGIPP